MGFELVYCYKCSKRLTEKDFQKGSAFRIGIHTTCDACADELLRQLSPEQQYAILNPQAQSASSTDTKRTTSKDNLTRIATTAPKRPKPASRSALPYIAGAVAAAILVLILMMQKDKRSAETEPGAQRPDKTVKAAPEKGTSTETANPPAPTKSLGPIAVFDPRRENAAREALQKARDFAKANPNDLLAQLRQYEMAELDAEKTSVAEDVLREKKAVQDRIDAALGPALQALEKEIQEPLDGQAYQRALTALEAARSRHAIPGWTEAVDRRIRETRDAAGNLFEKLKRRAQEARLAGSAEAMQRCRDEAAKWGIREYSDEIDRILQGAGGTPSPGSALPAPAAPPAARAA
jgi:hypothetical protein